MERFDGGDTQRKPNRCRSQVKLVVHCHMA
jgi:hypothetical protein